MIYCACDICGKEISESERFHEPNLKLDFCTKCASNKLHNMLKEYNQIKEESDLRFNNALSIMIKKYIKIKD